MDSIQLIDGVIRDTTDIVWLEELGWLQKTLCVCMCIFADLKAQKLFFCLSICCRVFSLRVLHSSSIVCGND